MRRAFVVTMLIGAAIGLAERMPVLMWICFICLTLTPLVAALETRHKRSQNVTARKHRTQ